MMAKKLGGALNVLKSIRDIADIKNEIRRLQRDNRSEELANLAFEMADALQIILLEKLSRL